MDNNLDTFSAKEQEDYRDAYESVSINLLRYHQDKEKMGILLEKK